MGQLRLGTRVHVQTARWPTGWAKIESPGPVGTRVAIQRRLDQPILNMDEGAPLEPVAGRLQRPMDSVAALSSRARWDDFLGRIRGLGGLEGYLLALLVPVSLLGAFTGKAKGRPATTGTQRYRNDSVLDIGEVVMRDAPDTTWHLLISCRSFMTLAAKVEVVEGRCHFRLRRALLEEVVHRYVTHARRPGVMRFRTQCDRARASARLPLWPVNKRHCRGI